WSAADRVRILNPSGSRIYEFRVLNHGSDVACRYLLPDMGSDSVNLLAKRVTGTSDGLGRQCARSACDVCESLAAYARTGDGSEHYRRPVIPGEPFLCAKGDRRDARMGKRCRGAHPLPLIHHVPFSHEREAHMGKRCEVSGRAYGSLRGDDW